jgi:hypothetical protein
VRSPSEIRLAASTVTISAATVKMEAAMVDAAGIVKCETMTAENVVANSYTPGAGNIW